VSRLCELAKKYGTDKTYYTPFYDLLLRGMAATKVLEIGIGTKAAMAHVPDYLAGASLRMWAEYFYPADVYGMDRDAEAAREVAGIQADQTIPNHALMDELGPFDLIVDDGSHNAGDQFKTLTWLLPHCRGTYIVEDAAMALLPMLDEAKITYTYAQVKTTLTGHCVILRGTHERI
jgi:hypothetical protein